MNAEDLRIGEQVQRLDGSYGVVVALRHLFGVAVRYNLTVADDHTYAVGAAAVVVHNCGYGSATDNKLQDIGKGLQNTIDDHLKPSDLSGALRDLLGNPVLKDSGDAYDHIGEVDEAIDGLNNKIENLSRKLAADSAHPFYSEADRCIAQCMLNTASQIRDTVQGYLMNLDPNEIIPDVTGQIYH